MTGIVESASIAASSAGQKQFVEIHNPAAESKGGQEVALSDAANEALSKLKNIESNLQNDLDAARELRERDMAGPAEGLGGDTGKALDRIEQMRMRMAEHMDVSVRVQQQLAQFMMVSSVSSSFGKNLNMFLRGQ